MKKKNNKKILIARQESMTVLQMRDNDGSVLGRRRKGPVTLHDEIDGQAQLG